MLFYEDEYFKNNVWLWDGKRYWAYDTEYMILVKDRRAIEWTPNVVSSDITVEKNLANVELHSITPNLKTYQLKELPDGEWRDVPNHVSIELKKDKNEILFRTINLAAVTGPEHRVVIARRCSPLNERKG
ncbi:MAG: hypothetical protein WD824_12330 [Cyclobacteriaceae bacterium]